VVSIVAGTVFQGMPELPVMGRTIRVRRMMTRMILDGMNG
jgi:hypothetical protein